MRRTFGHKDSLQKTSQIGAGIQETLEFTGKKHGPMPSMRLSAPLFGYLLCEMPRPSEQEFQQSEGQVTDTEKALHVQECLRDELAELSFEFAGNKAGLRILARRIAELDKTIPMLKAQLEKESK